MADKSCFVIAPIGAEGSDTRKRSDQVLRHIIKPAVEAVGGYGEPERADHLQKPGIITSQVVERVMNADLVVADLSEDNPNVFYELAIRHAVRKPVVQIIGGAWKIPFDVAPTRTVVFDLDLDGAQDAKKRIVELIKAAEADPANADTPLTAAIDLERLRASGEPIDRILGQLLEAVRAQSSSLESIRSALPGPFERYAFLGGPEGVSRLAQKDALGPRFKEYRILSTGEMQAEALRMNPPPDLSEKAQGQKKFFQKGPGPPPDPPDELLPTDKK